MKYLFCFFIVFTSGCSSLGGSKGTPYVGLNEFIEGTGQVYIYRPSRDTMSLAIPTLTINGETALAVRNGSYMVYDLNPGQHKFVIKGNANWIAPKMEFDVEVKQNERQFFRLIALIDGISLAGPGLFFLPTINKKFDQISKEQAITELMKLRYSGNWP